MCIMEVRAGQRSSTIAQAEAHNTRTVIDDADMFAKLLESRGEHERAGAVRHAASNLERAYADFLELFGEFAAEEETSHGRHHHHDDGTNERRVVSLADAVADVSDASNLPADVGRISHTHGDERPDEGSLIETAHHDAGLARRFETR